MVVAAVYTRAFRDWCRPSLLVDRSPPSPTVVRHELLACTLPPSKTVKASPLLVMHMPPVLVWISAQVAKSSATAARKRKGHGRDNHVARDEHKRQRREAFLLTTQADTEADT